MAETDEVIEGHGGWPDAFVTELRPTVRMQRAWEAFSWGKQTCELLEATET